MLCVFYALLIYSALLSNIFKPFVGWKMILEFNLFSFLVCMRPDSMQILYLGIKIKNNQLHQVYNSSVVCVYVCVYIYIYIYIIYSYPVVSQKCKVDKINTGHNKSGFLVSCRISCLKNNLLWLSGSTLTMF